MKHLTDALCHECAPREWRNVPDVTGSVELDRVIAVNPNKGMKARLQTHCTRQTIYGPRTGYNGYDGYSGDD
jgi:hypothetical protein